MATATSRCGRLCGLRIVWAFQGSTGIVGPIAIAFLVVCAAARLTRALWSNQRYWFSNWRWGKYAVVLAAIGFALQLVAR